MDIYLVGGAVRDELLGLPIKEHDYVVVGATPSALLALGYQQVGKDFPVFLHPETKDEYALARTERKSGQGYTGFICDFTPDVTLEADLARRDLTINAIAKCPKGTLHDPFNGAKDLENKVLRHVSPAFSEDPLRIIRLARFYARFAHLGFTIAPETLALVHDMVAKGELKTLTKERVWREFEKVMQDGTLLSFLKCLNDMHALSYYHNALVALVTQKSILLEGSLSRIKNAQLASRIQLLGVSQHLTATQEMALLETLAAPKSLTHMAEHARAIAACDTTHADAILQLFNQLDAWRKPERFFEALMLNQCIHNTLPTCDFKAMLKALNDITAQRFIAAGLQGPEIRDAIAKARLALLDEMIKS